jgi:signal transduction histidine kinase
MANVDVGEVLQRLEGYFAARLPRLDRSIEFTVHVAPRVRPVAGNPVLLEWAFENLIKNAVDVLAGRGGRIAVNAMPDDDGRCVTVRVVDDGPGVPTELRKHIFEPGVSSKEGGWGVGLTLTRRIVEDTHGGSIVLGKRRHGAEFIVTLPVVRSDGTT